MNYQWLALSTFKSDLKSALLGALRFLRLFFASLSGARNSVLARTTKRTPPAPREGLFWSRKHSAGLISVEMGLSFLNEHPAAPVFRTAVCLKYNSRPLGTTGRWQVWRS